MEEISARECESTALAAIESMGLAGFPVTFIIHELEGKTTEEVFALLDAKAPPSTVLVIAGDWRKQGNIDVYDLAKKFVEDNYKRARVKKFPTGMYVLIAEGRVHGPE